MPEANDANRLNPTGELAEIERALRDLAPAPPGVSRERLLFEAGRSSVPPTQRWLWQAVAGGFAILAVGFGSVLAFRAPATEIVIRDREVVRYVHVPVPTDSVAKVNRPEPQPSPAPESHGLVRTTDDDSDDPDARRMAQVRRDVLRWGVELLPEARPAPSVDPPAVTARDAELKEWMKLGTGVFASPLRPLWRPPIRILGGDE
jgi:hypothetical protein